MSERRGPQRRSLERSLEALRGFGRDGATLRELGLELDLGRGDPLEQRVRPWVDALVVIGRVELVPGSSPERYRLAPTAAAATDRQRILAEAHRQAITDAHAAMARAHRIARAIRRRS